MAATEQQKARFRERYASDPELRDKIKRRERERYANDPEFRERRKAYNRARQRGVDLKRKFGISEEQYGEMLRRQDGRCAVCGHVESEKTGRLHVDHDHATGQVRALLCGRCNRALGMLDEDPERIRALAAYVEQHAESGGDLP